MQSVINCPQCGGSMVADAAVSPVVLCPHCRAQVTVPPVDPAGAAVGAPPGAPVGAPYTCGYAGPQLSASPPGHGKAVASLVLGICSMILWLCPIVGIVSSVIGLTLGSQANKLEKRGMATAGVVLSSIALVLAIVNMGLGCYLGATGHNPWLNRLTH
jgi:hypothetical protein